MSIKLINGARATQGTQAVPAPAVNTSPTESATKSATESTTATAKSLPPSSAMQGSPPATAKPTVKATPTARAIELRQAVSKSTPLLASVPHVVAPVVRADIDYLQMAANAAQEAQQARGHTDHLLDEYLSRSLNAPSPDEPALDVQLWASIAFEFEHLEAQVNALAGLQAVNRSKLDHLQQATSADAPESNPVVHLQQAIDFDQQLEKMRTEVELAIACRDAVLEVRLIRLGLLQPH